METGGAPLKGLQPMSGASISGLLVRAATAYATALTGLAWSERRRALMLRPEAAVARWLTLISRRATRYC